VEAWNPGVRGAPALAKSLFGEPGYNRWGKLPVTVYDSTFSDSVEVRTHLGTSEKSEKNLHFIPG